MGKLTLDFLLDRKSNQDKLGLSTLELQNLGTIEIVKIKTRKVCEILDKYDFKIGQASASYDMMCELIYKSIPMLQANDLKSTLNVPTPYEIVGELFNFNEMNLITEHIFKLHGMGENKGNPINDEIKN